MFWRQQVCGSRWHNLCSGDSRTLVEDGTIYVLEIAGLWKKMARFMFWRQQVCGRRWHDLCSGDRTVVEDGTIYVLETAGLW
jgi:hypothetical protein